MTRFAKDYRVEDGDIIPPMPDIFPETDPDRRVCVVIPRNRGKYQTHWTVCWQGTIEHGGGMVELGYARLPSLEASIMFVIIGVLKAGNQLVLKPSILADRLGVTRQAIYKAFKNLEKRKIIEVDIDDHKINVNPELMWVGRLNEGVKRKNRDGKKLVNSRPKLMLVPAVENGRK